MAKTSNSLRQARRMAARIPGARKAYGAAVDKAAGSWSAVLGRVPFDRLPPPVAVHMGYEILLGRAPDESGLQRWIPLIQAGTLTNSQTLEHLRGSSEFENRWAFTGHMMGPSVHTGRCRWIRALPRAARIVDLGGTDRDDERGAMVSLGYPYKFDELTIVDLPPDDRHELYFAKRHESVKTDHGQVNYRYHSMVDLSWCEDASVDLVYSGQSIEHVTVDEGAMVVKQAMRILRPGGYLAIDTPNRNVTQLEFPDSWIDPDHKHEYTWPQMEELLTLAGFEIHFRVGLNHAGESVEQGKWIPAEVAGNAGMYHEIENCYILAVVARKPLDAPA